MKQIEAIDALQVAFGRDIGLPVEFSETGESFIKAAIEILVRSAADQTETLSKIAVALETLAKRDATKTTQYVELSNQTVATKQELKKRDSQIELLTQRLDKASKVVGEMQKRITALEAKGGKADDSVPKVQP